MNDHITWFGRYEGYLRTIARGVRENNPWCIECAAKLFDLMLPSNAIVIPMPGHLGQAQQMKTVALELAKRRTDIKVLNFLRCVPHEANYNQKKYTTPAPVEMYLASDRNIATYAGSGVFILDNVICTGVTASAALKVLPNATVVALAMSSWR